MDGKRRQCMDSARIAGLFKRKKDGKTSYVGKFRDLEITVFRNLNKKDAEDADVLLYAAKPSTVEDELEKQMDAVVEEKVQSKYDDDSTDEGQHFNYDLKMTDDETEQAKEEKQVPDGFTDEEDLEKMVLNLTSQLGAQLYGTDAWFLDLDQMLNGLARFVAFYGYSSNDVATGFPEFCRVVKGVRRIHAAALKQLNEGTLGLNECLLLAQLELAPFLGMLDIGPFISTLYAYAKLPERLLKDWETIDARVKQLNDDEIVNALRLASKKEETGEPLVLADLGDTGEDQLTNLFAISRYQGSLASDYAVIDEV